MALEIPATIDEPTFRRLLLEGIGVDGTAIPPTLDTATFRRMAIAALNAQSGGGGGGTVPNASETVAGISRFATLTEVQTAAAVDAVVRSRYLPITFAAGGGALSIGDLGGNARGARAINIQGSRALATQVAASADGIAIGTSSTAGSGVAIGTLSSTTNGQSIGYSAASQNLGVAIGHESVAGTLGVSIGRSATSGSYSTAIGNNSHAGDGGLAIGAVTAGAGSVSVGIGTQGLYGGSAFGSSVYASGTGSSAFGSRTTTIGQFSTAAGYYASTNGNYSSSFGAYATCNASYSAVFGFSRTTTVNNSLEIGLGISSLDHSRKVGIRMVGTGEVSQSVPITNTAKTVSSAGDGNEVAGTLGVNMMGWRVNNTGTSLIAEISFSGVIKTATIALI